MHVDAPSDGMPVALVDTHHHLWRLDAGAHYPWLQTHYDPARFMFGDYAALCRDFDVDAFMIGSGAWPRASCGRWRRVVR